MRLFIIFILLVSPTSVFSQLTYLLEAGIGGQSVENSFITNIDFAIGHSFDNNFSVYGGIQLQRHYTDENTSSYTDDEKEEVKLKNTNFLLFASSRYSVNLFKYDKNSKTRGVGFFPELRFYYAPFTDKGMLYENNDYKNKKGLNPRLLYGIGAGIFIGGFPGKYFAIKYEYCSSSMFCYNNPPHLKNQKTGFFNEGLHQITISLFGI